VGRQVLHSFEDFQLLCAVRKGAWGVEGLNERVARVLHNAGLIDSQQLWYEGARCW
jgi:exodeoxyribonuclease V alpha subunit